MELAIVLVIIGFIVGGIVAGRSLIESARITAVMQDIIQWRTAHKAFELQYDGIPGDLDNASEYWPGLTHNGNGDGMLITLGALLVPGSDDDRYYFQHLSLAGLVEGSYGEFVAGQEEPASPVPAAIYWGISSVREEFFAANTVSRANVNMLSLGRQYTDPDISFHSSLYAAITPKDAYTIDKKLDDSMPGMGNVIGAVGLFGWPPVPRSCATTNNINNATTAKYNLSEFRDACRMGFVLD